MALTLLEMIQTAAGELGLTEPSAVVSSTDLQTRQLYRLTNRDCIGLYRGHDWTDLQIPFIVNVETAISTTGDISTGSAVISNIPSTAGIDENYAISVTGAPNAQRVAEVLTTTSVRCSMLNTATATGATVTFGRDTYDLPSDFDRYIGNTWWDRSNFWRLIGPDSPQQDEYIRSGIFATGPRRRWRQIGRKPGAWRIWPPPFAGGAPPPGALVFEYISKNWVVAADGTTKAAFTADTDTTLIDDQLVIMGIKWRMWQIKGFDYASLQQEYLDAVSAYFATDGGIPDLYLNRRVGSPLITSANIPDGNWPSGTTP